MSEGSKKRKAFADWCRMGMRAWPTHAQRWRVGERLRPCVCGACEPDKVQHSVRAFIMEPWGWPKPSKGDAFTQVDIPDMTPCRIVCQGNWPLIEYYIDSRPRQATIERQYLSTEPVRACPGDGLLPARKARKVRG